MIDNGDIDWTWRMYKLWRLYFSAYLGCMIAVWMYKKVLEHAPEDISGRNEVILVRCQMGFAYVGNACAKVGWFCLAAWIYFGLYDILF